MTSQQMLITFNAGSSTVKIGLFAREGARVRRIGKGLIDFRETPLRFEMSEGPDVFEVRLQSAPDDRLDTVLGEAFSRLAWHLDLAAIEAVGHRVVHGGDRFDGPAVIDEQVLAAMHTLVPLAPMHQPQALRLIEAIARMRPDLRQTASFDTAFHRTNVELVRRFALPRELHDAGIKRYGFHGLSYKFIAEELGRLKPSLAAGRIVVAHLGSGASLCGLHVGESRDTSMGFSTLDGVPMGTRCGALDPGVLLHLLLEKRLSAEAVSDLLYHRSGLLGVSGISPDTRELLASSQAQAREALDLFALRVAGEIARVAATLGGLDGIVFTAGIGEHQPDIRRMICTRLEWLGVRLDHAANAANAQDIHTPDSAVAVLVIATDEEQIIANEAVAALQMG